MRLHRLRATSFAGIRDVDIAFGPGLNVLYGPNDLGKSTLVAAIRLAFLLPHSSTHSDQYVPWTGGDDPIVEMTFETDAQRIWRVRKQFGKPGSSLLHESRNGRDFDEVARERKVDGRLRDILRWGIPEPGGTGGGKGLPTSFLATALLSTQADVTALFRDSLQGDPTSSGKEQIASALQAVAQDSLFVTLLRRTQAERDSAYTPQGAKKTAKGSVFKDAAERLNDIRKEKDNFQKVVTDSEGAEKHLRELTERRVYKQETLAEVDARVANLRVLSFQALSRSDAEAQINQAKGTVTRIEGLHADVVAAEREVEALALRIMEAELALSVARSQQVEAEAALVTATNATRAEESDPGMADTVVRQRLELRAAEIERAIGEAQQRIAGALAAQKLNAAVAAAEKELREREANAIAAKQTVADAESKVNAIEAEISRCDLLERALDVQAADKRAADAQTAVDNETILRTRLDVALGERMLMAESHAAIIVPIHSALPPMRRLGNELATARGALDVGFIVTVHQTGWLKVEVRKDGNDAGPTSAKQTLEIEANREVEVTIGDVATVRVAVGRREAQNTVRVLEERWQREVQPHLAAAAVTDIDGLDTKLTQSRELDADIRAKDVDIESLRTQIEALSGGAETLRAAEAAVKACRTALGDTELDTLANELAALGTEPTAGLRTRRQKLAKEIETARTQASRAANAKTLGDERARSARLACDGAVLARDAVLTSFPYGVDASLAMAQSEFLAANGEKRIVTVDLTLLQTRIDDRTQRIEMALGGARAAADAARKAVETMQGALTTAITGHASETGRLVELRRIRDLEDLSIAQNRLREATERHAGLPIPDRIVTQKEVADAEETAARARSDLDTTDRDILLAQGALKQVGGAVARERLREATEALHSAERQEREVEADYEAWKLLLEQMKEADADQASNLGQALGPFIASRFQELTQRRYGAVQLTAQLGTEGILAGGQLRSPEKLSVGTREQLSTLYRLSLAEYLNTVVVLDDQLVQSDELRMDWFRTLLIEKARIFQIVVVTCRPGDYLRADAFVPVEGPVHADTDNGFTRAIDLSRAVGRR